MPYELIMENSVLNSIFINCDSILYNISVDWK